MFYLNSQQLKFIQNSNSLTQTLTKLANGNFAVNVIACSTKNLTKQEIQLLNTNSNQILGQVREVYLLGGNKSWVFARSYALKNELMQANLDLCKLKSCSLGNWLYQQNNLKRTQFNLFELTLKPFGKVIARSSIFITGTLNILVMEAFLPELWRKLKFT